MADAEFDRAVDRAVASAPAARRLLGIVACLAPRRIPVDVIGAAAMAPVERDASLAALVEQGVLQYETVDGGRPGFSVKPETQQHVRRALAATGAQDDFASLAARLVATAFPHGDDASDVGYWPECERLADHARAVLEMAPDDGPDALVTSDLLHQLSSYQFARGRFETAEPLVRRAGAIDEVIFGPAHPQVGQDLTNLAILLYEMDRLEEALPHVRRAVEIGEIDPGPEHPVMAERFNILATLLEALGRPAEADPYIRQAVLAAERALGPDHHETRAYKASYERIIAAVDSIARRDDAVEEGLAPPPPERLARTDLPPPDTRRGRFRRLLGRKRV